jgi:hypothetical protein
VNGMVNRGHGGGGGDDGSEVGWAGLVLGPGADGEGGELTLFRCD